MDVRAEKEGLAGGLLVAPVLLFVVTLLMLRVFYTVLWIVRILALLRLLILLAMLVLRFALLVVCHRGLRLVDTVFCATHLKKGP